MGRLGFTLTPMDTLFFRDGRPFNAADQAVGNLPTPMPLAGAFRTAILSNHPEFNFGEFNKSRIETPGNIDAALRSGGMVEDWYFRLQIRGPFLALQNGTDGPLVPLLPVPNNVVRKVDEKEHSVQWVQAEPFKKSLPGWRRPDGVPHLLPLWRDDADDEKHPGGFLTLDAIRQFLNGQVKEITDQDWFHNDDLFKFDGRTGIEIDPGTFTAADSKIYGIQLLALMRKIKRKWCGPDSNSKLPRYQNARVVLYAEVIHDGPSDDLLANLTGPIPLGGEGHYVDSRPIKPVNWPADTTATAKVWYMAAPGLFDESANNPDVPMWLPDRIAALNLRAASTGNPLAVSGWDVARKAPRPTRFAVPAGAVFYSENANVPDNQSLCSQPEDAKEGWGFALTGEWK